MSDTVRVRATSIGYYGHQRRKVGECFFIDGKLTKNVAGREDGEIQAFSDKWMVKVDEKATDEIEGEEPAAQRERAPAHQKEAEQEYDPENRRPERDAEGVSPARGRDFGE